MRFHIFHLVLLFDSTIDITPVNNFLIICIQLKVVNRIHIFKGELTHRKISKFSKEIWMLNIVNKFTRKVKFRY